MAMAMYNTKANAPGKLADKRNPPPGASWGGHGCGHRHVQWQLTRQWQRLWQCPSGGAVRPYSTWLKSIILTRQGASFQAGQTISGLRQLQFRWLSENPSRNKKSMIAWARIESRVNSGSDYVKMELTGVKHIVLVLSGPMGSPRTENHHHTDSQRSFATVSHVKKVREMLGCS